MKQFIQFCDIPNQFGTNDFASSPTLSGGNTLELVISTFSFREKFIVGV